MWCPWFPSGIWYAGVGEPLRCGEERLIPTQHIQIHDVYRRMRVELSKPRDTG